MDIYKRKSRIKILLVVAALTIGLISLGYTNYLARQIAKDEEEKVRLWAEALQKRANLVKLTGELFEKIKNDQENTIQNYADATSLIISTNDVASITFLSKIITGNTNIPVILTNSEGQIVDVRNIEEPASATSSEFYDNLLKTEFAVYPPIEIQYPDGVNFVYYSDSRIFVQLKQTLNDLIESFISEIVINSASLPVVLIDDSNKVIAFGNIDSSAIQSENIDATLQEMAAQNTPFSFDLGNDQMQYVYFKNSFLLTQLRAFPFIQFFLFGILVAVAYVGFSSSRNAEQNRVWVGLAKETAHQLGTPISSLSAWVDMMKESPAEGALSEQFIAEVEKDVNRLGLVAERFSKIGSKPDLAVREVSETLKKAMEYMESRASKKVTFTLDVESKDLYFKINEALFNWVIENLIKNALDAMNGVGNIAVTAFANNTHIVIDISDSGKGIEKGNFDTVFQPGFSTKKRGWGLGLSLVKRIINTYHSGTIFVKSSSSSGTTFRIKLPKSAAISA